MDNACLDSVRTAASTILSQSKNQVNILINNAGIMATPTLTLTPEGNELQFQTNHLAHFLLFQLLKPALLASSTPALHSRVVNVSSSGHRVFVFNDNPDYAFQHTPYESWTAYGQSKLANIYMTNYIDRVYSTQGLRATSVHPGGIISGLMKDMDPQLVAGFMADEAKMRSLKSWGQGAATTTIAAVGKEWEDRGGKYLVDCEETVMERGIAGEKEGFVSQTYDEDKEARLWKDSLELVGLDADL
ncbi:hypothetical protein B0O99DRAFT_621155 [Bisporella sp. PMI_857]|nr:hypothetical protein B0O99DRAFT_621155 [Bisporella sp. PMI_857]